MRLQAPRERARPRSRHLNFLSRTAVTKGYAAGKVITAGALVHSIVRAFALPLMSRNRSVLDVIVRSATVGLFHSYGVAAGPQLQAKPSEVRNAPLSGSIRFSGAGFDASLELVVPDPVLARIRNEPLTATTSRDVIRELTNQLMGRIKNKLLSFQVALTLSLPSISRHVPERAVATPGSQTSVLLYEFRTLEGPVFVILRGKFSEETLVFTSSGVSTEGDVILF